MLLNSEVHQAFHKRYVEAMRRYARATAHARQDDLRAFEAELLAMDSLAKSPEAVAMIDAGFPAPDIIRLAAHGVFRPETMVTQRFSLDHADAAYQALARGDIVGRAIVVP